MRFLNLRVQDFRNIEFAELDLSAPRTFLLGANGQGKSNLLEALGLVTALRSFRTQSMAALPRRGAGVFTAVYEVAHDQEGYAEVELSSGRSGRRLAIDGERVSRLGDFLGRFPVVPLSSSDLMILRGSPAERRRFLDLTLSAIDPLYYHALRNYHRGVAERNRLLKKGGSAAELSAFEAEIAPHAVAVATRREVGVQRLREVLIAVYADIAEADEGPELEFKVNIVCADVESVVRMLQDSRPRDTMMGATQKGPHRDDFNLSLSVGGAKEYASDGQQRGLCVALRLAQARIFQESLGLAPVLLADDVLGELDPHRKAGFWRACPPELQIIATGTELPEAHSEWVVWTVEGGRFTRAAL
jgi:DNA replication and repair protein RecF